MNYSVTCESVSRSSCVGTTFIGLYKNVLLKLSIFDKYKMKATGRKFLILPHVQI